MDIEVLENNFSNANLSNFDLSYSNHHPKDLTGAENQPDRGPGSNLTGADLSNANLRNFGQSSCTDVLMGIRQTGSCNTRRAICNCSLQPEKSQLRYRPY